MPLRGVDHRIAHRPGERGVVWLGESERGRLICVVGRARACGAPRRRLPQARGPQAISKQPSRVTRRRSASSRAASSCATRRAAGARARRPAALNFSWRLILAPPFVLDYLAAHEVAHIVHMNHSPLFWKLTRRLFPETDRAEAWLKTYGANLHRFGATCGVSVPASRVRPSARSPRTGARDPAGATGGGRRP